MTKGVLYRASGEMYVQEAEYSARSAKEKMDGIETALITDTDLNSDAFDSIIVVSDVENDFSDSILRPSESPFEKTLFLDSDTYVFDDVRSVFGILDEYDLAVTECPRRRRLPDKSEPYRELNTGVVLYNNTKEVDTFFEQWERTYWELRRERDIVRNQPSFSVALHDSDLDVFFLPREYNCFAHAMNYLAFDAKILHGRPQQLLPHSGKTINSKQGRRVYHAKTGILSEKKLHIQTPPKKRLITLFLSSMRRNGFRYTVKASINRYLGN